MPPVGIIIDNKQYTFQGVPPHVFLNKRVPSPIRDAKSAVYIVDPERPPEEPEEGGFNVYYVRQKYPRKGVILPEALTAVCSIKRPLVNTLSLAKYLAPFMGLFLVIPYFRRKILWAVADWYAKNSDYILNSFYLDPHKCCTTVRELLRVSRIIFSMDRLNQKERWIVDRCVISFGLMLEYDDQYRYHFQDAFGELNKVNFEKDSFKELQRIYAIMNSRDWHFDHPESQFIKTSTENRFEHLIIFIKYGLMFMPSWKRKVKEFVRELDVDKIKLDDGDFYHCMVKSDYQYRGIPFDKRIEMRMAIDKEFWAESLEKQMVEMPNV